MRENDADLIANVAIQAMNAGAHEAQEKELAKHQHHQPQHQPHQPQQEQQLNHNVLKLEINAKTLQIAVTEMKFANLQDCSNQESVELQQQPQPQPLQQLQQPQQLKLHVSTKENLALH